LAEIETLINELLTPQTIEPQFIQPQLPTKEVAILPDIEPEPEQEPTNYYIVNSDSKVELYFEYATYKNLPPEQQKNIKLFHKLHFKRKDDM
jgi:hypothetical protein